MNVALGFFAILAIFDKNFGLASLLILLGFIFDTLDGALARYLQSVSDFGIELDSLADALTFVLTPALLIYFNFFQTFRIGAVVSLFVIICGISRLAKFNTLKGVRGFIGMPTPFFAAVVISFVFLDVALKEQIAAILFFILGYLMISPVKYPDFKDPSISKVRYYGIGIIAFLVVLFLFKVDIWYIAIIENALLWLLILIPTVFSRAMKRRKYALFFCFGLGLASIAFYPKPAEFLALPIIYSIIAAPLFEMALTTKVIR